jgi:hypothetical protein
LITTAENVANFASAAASATLQVRASVGVAEGVAVAVTEVSVGSVSAELLEAVPEMLKPPMIRPKVATP